MNYNTDGFNERNNYIHNSNDLNRLKKSRPNNFDNSFAKMRMDENKPDIETVNINRQEILEETRGNKENFIVRNSRMNNILNRNIFKR